MTLTIDDRFAIDELYARYNTLVDGRDEAWAQVFTEDGAFTARVTYKGHDELRGYIQGLVANAESSPHEGPQHWNANLILEEDGEDVVATCYLIRAAKVRETGQYAVVTIGSYRDRIVKTGDKWLFAERVATIL